MCFFVKCFTKFLKVKHLQRILRSTENIFKFDQILQRKKHGKMLKIFSAKHFSAKLTERALRFLYIAE